MNESVFSYSARVVTILLATITGLWVRSQQPFFESRVLFGLQSHGYVKSGTPVIDRMKDGRLVSIFAMSKDTNHKTEKYDIAVSYSDDAGHEWSEPFILFNHENANDLDPNLIVDGDRILAFSTTVSKLATHRIDSSDIYMRSSLDGVNWKREVLLKKPYRYISGKIHRGYRLHDSTLIMGYAWDAMAQKRQPAGNESQMDNVSSVLRSKDGGLTWTTGGDIYAEYKRIHPKAAGGLCEPATVVLADGRIMALARNGTAKLYQSWSSDHGITWSQPQPSQLTAHNSPAALWKIEGSNKIVVVWNESDKERNPLSIAVSGDGGKTWGPSRIIAQTGGMQAAYPSLVQAKDGTFILIWHQATRNNKVLEVRMARFNLDWLMENLAQ